MRRLFLFSLSLVLVFVLAARVMAVEAETGSGSKLDAQALDAYIQGQMSKHGLKGVSLAITSKTEILYLKGYGVSGNGRAMTPQTPMYIGSQSKSFTALAIAQLIEQGKIDPYDPVQRYIPWFRVRDEAASQLITIVFVELVDLRLRRFRNLTRDFLFIKLVRGNSPLLSFCL